MLRAGTYSVCFTDLRGSTPLRVHVGDETFDDLRRRHDAVLAASVAASEGTVVKSLGDGILAVFTGAVAALDAAVSMQQGIDRLNATLATPLDLAIGISVGDVAVESDDVHGTPVVEASRLCGVARSGEVLVSDLVRRLAGSRGGHRFEPRGELWLKGLPEPIRASIVTWEPMRADTRGAFCAPELSALSRAGFVGRARERERLLSARARVANGGTSCVLVGGEPGIGKTRLVGETAAQAHADGATVLFGGCDQDAGVAYQPWARALTGYVAALDPVSIRAKLGSLGAELSRIVPSIMSKLPDIGVPLLSDPDSDRLRLFESVGQLLAAIARDGPVVIVLDDLHWADQPSLLLLRHIARSNIVGGTLIVGTYRDTDLDRAHPLSHAIADLTLAGLLERVPLEGLAREEVDDYLRAVSGQELGVDGEELSRAVFAKTEGNPFFLGEVVQHLVASGSVAHDGSRWTLSRDPRDMGLPAGIREMVARRLSSMSRRANDVLTVAAISGARFDASIVAIAMGESLDTVFDGLDEAIQMRMITEGSEPGRYAFVHALVRQTLEAELTSSRRARWHRAIGQALETAPDASDNVAELARHFAACATLGEEKRAIRYLREAADRARHDLAFEEAAARYAQAIDVLDRAGRDPLLRGDLMTARGAALRDAGDPAHRQLLFDAVSFAGEDGHRLASIAIALNPSGMVGKFHGIDDEVIALCERALVALGPADSPDRARVLSLIGAELGLSPDHAGGERGRTAEREAIDIARRLGDRRCLGHVLAAFWGGLHGPDTFDEAVSVASELEELADELGDEQLRLESIRVAVAAAFERGDIERGLELNSLQVDLATRLHNGHALWEARHRTLGVELFRLELDRFHERCDAVADSGIAGGVSASVADGVRFATKNLADMWSDPPSLAERLETIEAIAPLMPGVRSLWASAAEVALELGETERARRDLHHVSANGFSDWPRSLWWTAFLNVTVTVAARLGDLAACEAGYQLLLPFKGRYSYSGATLGLPVDTALGASASVTGRDAQAHRFFENALQQCDRSNLTQPLVVTQISYAEALLRMSAPTAADISRARELLIAARDRSSAAGAHVLAGRADRILAVVGPAR